jgi:glyoxylase-like metal-dependent hydrolase (beta-lactamase superfamily II)
MKSLVRKDSFFAALMTLVCLSLTANTVSASPPAELLHKKWNHGSTDCDSNTDPAIEAFGYDQSSFILRQNKCLSFEAPFIYLLVGEEKAVVLDTGASDSAEAFPLYETVRHLVGEKELLVLHSHSHSDHTAGDNQFRDRPGVRVVDPNYDAMTEYFGFTNWPDGQARIELGGRELIVLPTPGHQEEAISVYDPHTRWLLTGDTVYPGYIYVKHWKTYRNSIARLTAFTANHDVSLVLGAHIEMTNTEGEYYPIGTIYQPQEAPLPLSPATLSSLDSTLQEADEDEKIVSAEMIVAPMNVFQRTLSNVARWITQ